MAWWGHVLFHALLDGIETKVRVVTLDGAPWFVAADVCRVLGIALNGGVNSALRCVAPDERRPLTRSDCKDLFLGVRAPSYLAVSEPGLFRLVMRSDKPVARPFQDWVTREVLSAIRKTGSFTLEPGEAIPLPASFADALRQHATTLIKLAEEQEQHGKTRAEREAALAAKAQAEAEVGRLEPLAQAGAQPL